MNYELVKELYTAGWPQTGGLTIPNKGQDWPYLVTPTLEELIEACGDKLCGLSTWEDWNGDIKVVEGWLAYTAINMDGAPDEDEGPYGKGSTPTEAVARLWLALNKKQ